MAYSSISKPSLHFNVKLYTGTGSTQSITGVGFQPDWVWIKNRSTSHDHILTDAVRGVTKDIRSNNTDVESTDSNGLTAFGADGFTVGSKVNINNSGSNIVSWNWKANGAGSANSDGSQSSTVSVNTTAGFSIVKFVNNQSYTTNTFGHGLGAVPKVILMRSLDSAYNWDVYHHKIAVSKRLILNSTSAEASSTYMNSTSPTNQVFTVKSDEFDTNDNCIAYCFAEKKGYSKFGYYKGNGNADGPFIYCGFQPAFIIAKKYSATGPFHIYDKERANPFNVVSGKLVTNAGTAEAVGVECDFLSNGFKIRASGSDFNADGTDFMYMAFAEEPLVANVGAGIPATAR